MFKKLLNTLGYVHESELRDLEKSPLTLEELNALYSEMLTKDDLNGGLDKKEEEKLFSELSKVDGFMEYLRDTMAMDMKRYFKAPVEGQAMIKGAFSRTLYFKSLLGVKNKPSNLKLKGSRYAS